MKKILIFGGGGFVGGNLAVIANRTGWDICIATRSVKPGFGFALWKTVDITNRDQVEQVIAAYRPQVVVNLAAMAAIDRVEKERQLAWQINVQGARNIAESCNHHNIRHLYISSDAVFDGEATSYLEDAHPNPVNYYGQTKVEAEKAVLEYYPNSVVARISLVLGFPLNGGNSLFASLATKRKYGKKIPSPKNEIRTPVDVITLSECILELAENDFTGIVHIGSTDAIDRYTLTRKIVRAMEFDAAIVVPAEAIEPNPDRAPRHRNGILDISQVQKCLATKMLSVDEGLRRAFQERIQLTEV